MASKESNKLRLLQSHVRELNDQKNEVNRKKSDLLDKKYIAISDVSAKCVSLKKSINKSKTSAIRKLNDFYEEQEKLLDDALANLETRLVRAEEELIIDLNGIPVPAVKVMSYDFDVTKAQSSIDQLELRSSMNIQDPPKETQASTSKGSEAIKKTSSPAIRTTTTSTNSTGSTPWYNALMTSIMTSSASVSPLKLSVSAPKKPRLVEGQKREYVRDYIRCNKCHKPRCIYRAYVLTDEEKMTLSTLRDSASYVCGRKLPSDISKVTKTLDVEGNIDCKSVVNWHYFNPKLKNPPVCYVCGSNRVSPISEEEKQEYRSLHKICSSCERKGEKPRSVKQPSVEDSDDWDSDITYSP